jgi:hypothetical protein
MNTLALRPHNIASNDTPLVFLHLPKTAGTTLWLILRRQYSPRAVLRVDHAVDLPAVEEEQWSQSRVLLGHLAYGVHHFARQPDYVTVLREPLERTLSQYCHWARDKNCHWSRESDVHLSLGEYLAVEDPRTDNLQTRMLAGPEAEALPFGRCDRDVFEVAKRNLTENIAVVGVTERFDETLLLLQRRFGWGLPCYVSENVGTNRISRDDVPRDQLKQIWEMTRWDRELYALANAKLDERIALEGPDFADALRRFRIANTLYRRMKIWVAGPLQALKSRLPLNGQMGLESAVRNILEVTHKHATPQSVGTNRRAV